MNAQRLPKNSCCGDLNLLENPTPASGTPLLFMQQLLKHQRFTKITHKLGSVAATRTSETAIKMEAAGQKTGA